MADIPSRLTAALSDRYSIERELGEGGMATVYLAEDLKHDRRVAIKVLKPELAAVLGAERFLAEIKTTAGLQHPNILPLFDSGEADSFLYYVMPYVEGESLRDRLDRERQLPVQEAVDIATEVASALDYAHRHGVVHRDIKPENILLHDGRPVVADFGIALAVSAAAGGRMTETGLSLGTPHYMSPEQATADRDIGGRSDVYSLGAVLYEMLTGQPPHTGSSAQQIIARIVTEKAAPVTKLRPSVPPNVAAAVSKALEKLPADRFESAKAFAEALANPGFRHGVTETATRAVGAAAARSWRRLSLALVGTLTVALAAALWGWMRPQPMAPLIRYRLGLPDDAEFVPGTTAPAPAPDGSFLVYSGPGANGNGVRLWIKRRDSDRPAPIVGTDGAESFAISPDGAWIAFTRPAPGPLQRVPVNGGAPVTIANGGVAPGAGLTWLNADTLVVPDADATSLEAIAATGGAPRVLYHSDSAQVFQPVALPGGRGLLFGRCFSYCAVADLWALDPRSGEAHQILPDVSGSSAYLDPGYVAYDTRAGGLFAVPFDPGRLQLHGTPIPIADSLMEDFNVRTAPFQMSRSGTLVMELAPPSSQGREEMVWVQPQGRVTPVDTSWTFELTRSAGNTGWALSPDGKRLAIGLHVGTGDEIWVKQLPDGPAQQITNDSLPAYRPRWTADGRYVTFVGGDRHPGFFEHRADGVGADSLLVAGFFDEGVIAPGGQRYLLRTGHVGSGVGGRRIMEFRPGVDSVPAPLISAGAGHDADAVAVSPDGRWIAYASNETGAPQVFLRPFPDVSAGKWQVSRSGGAGPLWSRDGDRLFYLRDDGTMMSVPVTAGASPPLGDPVAMFRVPGDWALGLPFTYTPWDVAPDGRFIIARTVAAARTAHPTIVIVQNWLRHWERGLRK